MVPLTPPPSQTTPIPSITNNNPSQAGAAFVIQGSHTYLQSIDNSVVHILDVSINGQSCRCLDGTGRMRGCREFLTPRWFTWYYPTMSKLERNQGQLVIHI